MLSEQQTQTLEQLSAAATQGEWSVFEYDAGSYIYDAGGFPTPSIQCEEADCAIVHWDGFKQEYWVSANGNAKQIEANAAFIVTLVNAYRTGQLVEVQADDATVERVARALYEEDDPWHKAWPWPDLQPDQGAPDAYRRLAKAAIAAMKGPKL